MSKLYTLKVNDNYEFSVDKDNIQDIDIIKKFKNQYHIIEGNTSYKANLLKSNFSKKEYQISINGNKYNVLIKDKLDQLIKDLGLTINGKQKDTNIKAPMPGLILEISVSKGQEVKEGDILLVLEAMKMENMLIAPQDGVIKSIEVQKGDAVDKKQLLIEME